MKFLFAASDPQSIQKVSRKLKQAGIRYELRDELAPKGAGVFRYCELWVPEKAQFQYERLFWTPALPAIE